LTTIGAMVESDIDGVRELESGAGLATFGRDWFEGKLGRDETIFLVARKISDEGLDVHTSKVVGVITGWVVVDEWHIFNLVVSPEYKRRGIGEQLLRSGARAANMRGATRAVLEVRESNEAARRLYLKLGFVVLGRRRDYYREPLEDALTQVCAGVEWAGLVD
jgi:ribosomal-protein-alanine N-acetyltransferase